MADYTLTSVMTVKPWRSPWGAFPTRTHQLISTTPTVHVGRVMHLNWTGSTNAGQVTPSTSDTFFFAVGIAASSATAFVSSAVSAPAITIWEANPAVEFRANTYGAVITSSQVGLHKKLVWDSTLNCAFINLGASTAADWRVVITGLIDNDGDSGGAVSFKFLSRLTENIGSSVAVTSTSPVLAFYC